MIKRLAFMLGLLALVLFLVSLDPLRGAFGFLFGWVLLGYLVWRALPGVRADLGRLRGHRPARMGRYRGSFL